MELQKLLKKTKQNVVSVYREGHMHLCMIPSSLHGWYMTDHFISSMNDIDSEIEKTFKQYKNRNYRFLWYQDSELEDIFVPLNKGKDHESFQNLSLKEEKDLEKIHKNMSQDELLKKDNDLMSTADPLKIQKTTSTMDDLSAAWGDAKYFIAARQLTDGVKSLILMILEDNLKDKKYDKRKMSLRMQVFKEDLLETPVGSILIANAAALIIKHGAEFGQEYVEILKHPALQKFAHTLRVQSLADGGNTLIDKLKDLIKPLFSDLNLLTSDSKALPARIAEIKESAAKLAVGPIANIAQDLLEDAEVLEIKKTVKA